MGFTFFLQSACVLAVLSAVPAGAGDRAESAGPAQPCTLSPGPTATVARILDGETLQLDDGQQVRLIGALAPRHVLIVAPTKDSNFRADSVDRIVAAARPGFRLHGHPDRLRVEHPDCEHDFPNEMRETAYKLFDSVLKP